MYYERFNTPCLAKSMKINVIFIVVYYCYYFDVYVSSSVY
jgi:hypothetical protein